MKMAMRPDGRSYVAPSALRVFSSDLPWAVGPGYCIARLRRLSLHHNLRELDRELGIRDELNFSDLKTPYKTFQL